MTLLIKTITSVLKVSIYIITSFKYHPVGLASIVAKMSVSTFTTAYALMLYDTLFRYAIDNIFMLYIYTFCCLFQNSKTPVF